MAKAKTKLWALKLPRDRWYPPDHFLLDDKVMKDSRNAKPFYERIVAEWFQSVHEGSEVVPHPHPELWSYPMGVRDRGKIK